MLSKISYDFLRGGRSESGNIALMFGLTSVILVGLVGTAIDTSRAVHAGNRTAAALDAAALAAAKALNTQDLTDAAIRQIAQATFDANTKNNKDGTTFDGLTMSVNRDAGSVQLSINVQVETTFTKVLNFDKIDVARSVTAVYKMKDVELSMMLDVSGSMSGQKIADLRLAATDVVDILIPENSNGKSKIGIAPYSTSVNAGAYANIVTNGNSQGCVSERSGAAAFTDASPGSYSVLNLPSVIKMTALMVSSSS